MLIQHRMETYLALLRSTAALFAVDGDVTRDELETFLQRQGITRRFPGIQGTGFCRQTGPGSCPIVYLEPQDYRNRKALGYDMYAEPVRRATMERARDTGQPAATSRVTLAQETGPNRPAGFLIYLPVYRGGAPPATVEERRADLLGFVYNAFRADDLFGGILPPGEAWTVGFEVFAGSPEERNLLHRSHTLADAESRMWPRYQTLGGFEVAESSWTVAYATLPRFAAGSSRPQTIWLLLSGLVTSAVLFLLARAQVRAEMESARLYEAEHRARAEAETANQAKDRFMATLSHELRTPLTPVLAVISTLESRLDSGGVPSSGELREGIVKIRRNVELEARLIDDLLDLTRISQGKLELKREITDLREILEHALETSFGPLSGAGRPRLCLDLAAGDHRLWADAPRLTQVFWNLLSNALKFTPPEGEVSLRTRREEPDLVVEVADTGIGIDPQALPHVFDAFVQGPRDITRQFGGLGLGLAISKAIVGFHGGSLTAASEGSGRGATFTVRLPAALPKDAEAPRPEPAAAVSPSPKSPVETPKSLHVLLVEDHLDTAEAMADLLRATGRQVTVAYCVSEALAVADEARGRFDLVLSDVGLPDGTGHDLMRELRRRYSLPGIALTGYGMEEDVERSREAGFVRHLTKPVHLDTLEAAIRQVTEVR